MNSTTYLIKTKLILDVNVIISAVLYGGNCETLLRVIQISTHRYELCFSDELVNELNSVVKRKFKRHRLLFDEIQELLLVRGTMFQPKARILVCRDRNDNYLLELCEESNSDYLITGDKDLIELKSWGKTRILKPSEFLNYLEN